MALKGRLSGVSILVFFVISAGLWTLGIAAEEQQSDPGIVICGKMTMTLNHKWSYLIPYIGPTECQPVLNASVDVFDDPDTAYTDWTGGVKFRFVIDIDDNTDLYYAVITAGATLEEKVSDYPPVYHKIDHRTTAHITPAGTEDTSIILEFATDTVSATDVTKNYRVTAGGRIQVSGYVFTYPSWNDSDTESDIIVANRSHSQWQQVVELLMVLPGPPYYIGDNLRLLGGVSTESGEGDPVSETEVCIVLATQRGFGSQTIYTETPPAGGGINEVFSIDNPMGAGILTISAYDKAKSEEYVFDEDGEEIKINLEVPEDWSTFGMYSIPCSEAQIPGLAAAYSVNLVSFNDFSGMVDLAVSGLPDATTAAFDIDPVPLPYEDHDTVHTYFHVFTTPSTPLGLHKFALIATCDTITRIDSIPLLVGSLDHLTSAEDIRRTPAAVPLLESHPNPFNPSVTITYDLPRDALIDISIFDVKGGHVAALRSGFETAGRHSIEWDGTNDRSVPVVSGVYFARLEYYGDAYIRKVVLIR